MKNSKYIDANLLTQTSIQKEILNSKTYKYSIFTSQLAIGEAISNMILKNHDINTIIFFIETLHELSNKDFFKIVKSDFRHEHYCFFVDNTSLVGTDAIHLALAIENPNCISFITGDSNFTGYKSLGRIIKNKFNRNFNIEKRKIEN